MNKIFVSDLAAFEDGKSFPWTYFLLTSKQQRTSKNGSLYLSLIFSDKSGQIDGRAWDLTLPGIAKDFEQGDVVAVKGSVSRYDGKAQIKIDEIRKARAEGIDKTDLMPATIYDVNELWTRLRGFVDSFTDPHLKQLLNTLLDDERIGGKFREAPAAKQLHHAWLGGLLEHVVSLLTLADSVAPNYPILNRDLLLTGVILHDIGKVQELAWDTGFEYTVEGVLLGHIQMGYELAAKTIDMLPDFPPRLRTLVLHLILSHHGKLEFGSPKLPMIPEALVLSFVDDLDAKMMAAQQAFDKATREGKSPDEFTDKVWALDNRQMLNTKAWLESNV